MQTSTYRQNAKTLLSIAIVWTLCGLAIYYLLATQQQSAHRLQNLDGLTADQLLELAESQYWFALADEGDPDAIRRGLGLTDAAASMLNTDCATHPLTEQCDVTIERTGQLQTDLQTLHEAHHDTLFGMFPVLSLVRGSLLLNPGANGNYEAIDDPEVAAVTKAANQLADLLDRTLPYWPTLHVTVSGFDQQGKRPDLETEVLSLLNGRPRFYVHPGAEIEPIIRRHLGKEAAESYSLTGRLTDSIRNILTTQLQIEDLIALNFAEQPTVDNQKFFIVSAKSKPDGPLAGANGASAMGLVHDTGGFGGVAFKGSISMHIALLVIVALVAWNQEPRPFTLLVIAIGFALGRLFPLLSLHYLLPLQPAPDTLAWLSWWWIGLLSFTLVVLPLLILRLATAKIAVMRRLLAGCLGILGLALGAGVVAWATWPALAYFGGLDGSCRLLLAGSLYLFYSYLFGRTLDEADVQYPLSNGFLVALTLLLFPLALFSRESGLLWISIISLLLFANSAVAWRRRPGQQNTTNTVKIQDPFSLVDRISAVRSQEFDQIWQKLNNKKPSSNLRLCHLYGTEPQLSQAMAKAIAARCYADFPETSEIRTTDLTRTVIATGWEPINDLLDIKTEAEQETKHQNFLNEFFEAENSEAEQSRLASTAFKTLQQRLSRKPRIIWVILGLKATEAIIVVNALKALFERIQNITNFKSKELIIVTQADTKLDIDFFNPGLLQASNSREKIASKVFFTHQEHIPELEPDEIHRLLTSMIKGDVLVRNLIQLTNDTHDGRGSKWSTVVTWLKALRDNGYLKQDIKQNRLRQTVRASQLETIAFSISQPSEDDIKMAAKLDTMELHYLRLALCFGETFDTMALAIVLRDQSPAFKVLSDYQALAQKTGWYFAGDNAAAKFRFDPAVSTMVKNLVGLQLNGEPTYLLQEGQRFIADNLFSHNTTDPRYLIQALRLYGQLPVTEPLQLFEQVKKACQIIAGLKHDKLATELLEWATTNNIAALSFELGEEQNYRQLELLLQSIIANKAYGKDRAMEVSEEIEIVYPAGVQSIPRNHLAELTFSRFIAKTDSNPYAQRLIEEGDALGHLWLRPEGETNEKCADRLGSVISDITERGTKTNNNDTVAKLLNQRARILTEMASSKENIDDANNLFENAVGLFKQSIVARLHSVNGPDLLGLQMNYQGLGGLYSEWELKQPVEDKASRLYFLEQAEKAYRKKLEYSSERDAFGRALGLCSLGETVWAIAWLEYHDREKCHSHEQDARSILFEAREICIDNAPHYNKYPVEDKAARWAYNLQCWSLIRLSQLPGAGDAEKALWRLLYESIGVASGKACDPWFSIHDTEKEGYRFMYTNETPPETQAKANAVEIAYEFVKPGTKKGDEITSGELWLDVGGKTGAGVLDHHAGPGESAAQLVSENPQVVLDAVENNTVVKLVTHTAPDLDAISAVWLARRVINQLPGNDFGRALAKRATRWDQGFIESSDRLENCWEVAFYTALEVCPNDLTRLHLGMGLLDLTEQHFLHSECWQTTAPLLLEDAQRKRLAAAEQTYEEDESCGEVLELSELADFTGVAPARLLCVANPETAGGIIKVLAKRDGYIGSIVSVPQQQIMSRQVWRHWIRLDPDANGSLEGLGKRLDAAESAMTQLPEVVNKAVFEDWYDGRAHHYTIVDSPRMTIAGETSIGSLLSPQRVKEIVAEYFQ